MESNTLHYQNTGSQPPPSNNQNPWLEALRAFLEFLALRDDPPWLKAFKVAVYAALVYLLISNGYDISEWWRAFR